MMRKSFLVLALILIPILSTACGDDSNAVDTTLEDPYDIDPVFREFFDFMGGRGILGQPISPMFIHENVKYQYTVAALMVHDPQAPANQRFHLGSLGLDLDIEEPPVPRPDQSGVRYVDGHIIDSVFVPMYEKLGGARYVGRPVTEMHYNPEIGRYEQHFENLGMFWMDGEIPENVRLLAYGAWKCNSNCIQPPLGDSQVILPRQVGELFIDAVTRLGPDFTGFALTDTYITPDRYTEQVYENVVLVSNPNQPSRVFLRAISESLGIRPDPLVDAKNDPNIIFFPINGGKGYNVPNHFLDYMAHHGGMDASGPPIGELVRVKDNVYSQCFTNLCLEEHYNAMGTLSIKPAQLGYTYKLLPVQAVEKTIIQQIQTPQPEQQEPAVGSPPPTSDQPELQPTQQVQTNELSVQVWESYPSISPNQIQEIGVSVFENGVPLPNVEPDLVLTLPDGSKMTYYMVPTGEDGKSRILLDPINSPNSTVIPYEVCIYNPTSYGRFCVMGSFLIWQNP